MTCGSTKPSVPARRAATGSSRARYGGPTVGASPEAIDAAILDEMSPIVDDLPWRSVPRLRDPRRRPWSSHPARITVHAGGAPVDLTLRRFGDEDVPLTTLAPSSDAVLWLEGLEADEPWLLRADGGCL